MIRVKFWFINKLEINFSNPFFNTARVYSECTKGRTCKTFKGNIHFDGWENPLKFLPRVQISRFRTRTAHAGGTPSVVLYIALMDYLRSWMYMYKICTTFSTSVHEKWATVIAVHRRIHYSFLRWMKYENV